MGKFLGIDTCRGLRPGVVMDLGEDVCQQISAGVLKNLIFTVNVTVGHRSQ